MKYKRFIRMKTGEEFAGYCRMNGLLVADLGEYKDRRAKLCYHFQNPELNNVAILRIIDGKEAFYDIFSDIIELPKTIIYIVNEHTAIVENLDEIKPIGLDIAKLVYDIDNNRCQDNETDSE